jgi:hypothetical protein
VSLPTQAKRIAQDKRENAKLLTPKKIFKNFSIPKRIAQDKKTKSREPTDPSNPVSLPTLTSPQAQGNFFLLHSLNPEVKIVLLHSLNPEVNKSTQSPVYTTASSGT